MSTKIKRGLGLLVVAVIALLTTGLIAQIDRGSGVAGIVVAVAYALSGLVMVGAFCVGLGLLAWGLLRE